MALEGMLTKDEVVAVYARAAPVYDLWARLTETRARRRALEIARVRDGEDVLEVAVGTGLAFAELLALNPNGRNEGVDLTEAMVARARRKAEGSPARRWRLRVGDAYRLDFPAAAFDLVLNSYMLDLLPSPDFPRVLGEFRRVLRPGGRLVLANLAPGSGPIASVWSAVHRTHPAWVGGCRPVEVAGAVREAGFAIETVERVWQLGVPTELLLALNSR